MSNPQNFPPVEQWPTVTPPDCPLCQRPADAVWIGPATYQDGTEVNVWRCRACRHDWHIPTRHWPVLNGPDCPYCLTKDTCWAAHAPDVPGDLWTCDNGHEFVLTPEGLIILPEEAG
ncbi:hypothetical protein ACQPZP_40900 [Spirillospora sp. CA-142024]|uniref:hypothetical protein n=1 Tax=Spirillospora sp. CA-142024 TaxID=3240036 RepID=UPI003D945455